ncbi:MAG: cupin domain-containing protein [Caldilineaceae bacterium]|nr:cupin domain-containing protein [Caldilineaceae bacterium]
MTRHLWGDPQAGEVADWIYASTEMIHQLLFGLKPGAAFRHSDSFRTVFAADIVYYVLSGVLALANPESGEVQRILPGEGVFFRRDTWHHAFNMSSEPLRVLEYFAPPPSQGTSGSYARTQPLLEAAAYQREDAWTRWPMERASVEANSTLRVIREQDYLWHLTGDDKPGLVGLLASTEHLTVGKLILPPGSQSAVERHAGDECLYVLEGTVNVHLPEHDAPSWFELSPQDGFYLPADAAHRYHNMTDRPASLLFGVAPEYQSSGAE